MQKSTDKKHEGKHDPETINTLVNQHLALFSKDMEMSGQCLTCGLYQFSVVLFANLVARSYDHQEIISNLDASNLAAMILADAGELLNSTETKLALPDEMLSDMKKDA